ncbi:hypothetical protein BDY24DRAFT_337193 [Mrakia frigida]|uniref:sterol desaturase family protein n=1 Tax=Mrakia frigida TaxID=29902 RepID=UPI003FCC0D84
MDYILDFADEHYLNKLYASLLPATDFLPATSQLPSSSNVTSVLTSLYKNIPHPPIDASTVTSLVSAWPQDYILRQAISLYFLTLIGIFSMYFALASMSYFFLFNHHMMKHPRFIKGQVGMEIRTSMVGFPWMTLMTLPWFLAEVRGRGMFYENISDYGWGYAIFSIPAFLLFTDTGIYWIHRLEHHPRIYKHVHKLHHKWIIPTPFASHAFKPLEGYAQSVPYHLFPTLFPLHKTIYLCLFTAVNAWSIFIHDSDMVTGSRFEKIINGPAHHTLHHLYFTVNYGQYFTFSDRLGSSYMQPAAEHDPMVEVNRIMGAKMKSKDQ